MPVLMLSPKESLHFVIVLFEMQLRKNSIKSKLDFLLKHY